MMDGEDHSISLIERNDFRSRLHPWTLLGQDEFSSREITSRLRKKKRNLKRKDVFSVEILMEAVEIARFIFQKQRCRPRLARLMTALDEIGMRDGIACVDAHRLIPSIRDCGERWIQLGSQTSDQLGQGIGEVLVLAASKSVASHDNAAPEPLTFTIARR